AGFGAQARGPRQHLSRAPAERGGPVAMKRVLVVDDEQRMRRVLQILIEKLGLESHGAESAERALEYLQGNQVDLVLTDLRMPGLGGLEFLARLRAIDGEVPVIVLTAYGTVSSAVDAMQLAAFDFLF